MPLEIKRGIIKEVDLTGKKIDNVNGINPAVKVTIFEGNGWDSGWLPVGVPKCDSGGNWYMPLDIDAEVSVVCPDGGIEQAVVTCSLSRTPDEAGSTDTERAKHVVMKFGDLLILMNRGEGEEEYTITIPGSAEGKHLLTMRRKIDSRGIIIQTAGGHYLVFQDLEADRKVELKHSIGTRLTFEKDGSWTAVIVGDMTTGIDGDRKATVGGDDTLTVGGDSETTIGGDATKNIAGNCTMTVGRTINVTATGDIKITGATVEIKGSLVTIDNGIVPIPGGVVTGKTQRFCNYNGTPMGCELFTVIK